MKYEVVELSNNVKVLLKNLTFTPQNKNFLLDNLEHLFLSFSKQTYDCNLNSLKNIIRNFVEFLNFVLYLWHRVDFQRILEINIKQAYQKTRLVLRRLMRG